MKRWRRKKEAVGGSRSEKGKRKGVGRKDERGEGRDGRVVKWGRV